MDVRLSPEQRGLRDTAAQLVGRLGLRAVGQLDDGERRAKLDAAVAAAGWRELRTPAEDGSPWGSGVEVALVAEQLGRGLADTPYLGSVLAAELRRLAGAPIPPEPETVVLDAGLGALAVATTPTGVLPARAVAIDADGAGQALLLTPAGAGTWQLASVELQPPAIAVDLTRPTAAPRPGATASVVAGQQVALDDDAIGRWTALGLAATSADLVGAMQGAVDLARAYATERRQYGQPVGAFQAVQHLLADAFVTTEGARSATVHAAWAVDALAPGDALAAGAIAKAYAARAARGACETAIQVHGGIGNTWECLAHVFLRRALLSSDVLGGIDANLKRVLIHQGIERAGAAGRTDGLR
jgi:hypothetical protein